MIDQIFTDIDGIILSELSYQNIDGFKKYKSLYEACYDNGNIRMEIKNDFSGLTKHLETFPKYYEDTLKKYQIVTTTAEKYNASGYYAAAFYDEKNHSLIIANRGTESTKLNDLLTDGSIGIGRVDYQFADANQFYLDSLKYVLTVSKLKVNSIYVTGHSLGGGLAALQFASFYQQGGRLKGGITFEAPGMKRVLEHAQNCMPDTALNRRATSVGPHAGIAAPNANLVDRKLYNDAQIIHNGYAKLSKLDCNKLVQYGTNVDWVYNTSTHIGQEINPLVKGGKFVGHTTIGTAYEYGASTDIWHSINTYKIYKLENKKYIEPGCIDSNRFLKLLMPLLAGLKIDHKQVSEILNKLYETGFTSPSDVRDLLTKQYSDNLHSGISMYSKSAKNDFDKISDLHNLDKDTLYTDVYRYSVLFGFLKNSSAIDKAKFLTQANGLIKSNQPMLKKHPEQNKVTATHKLECQIIEFEHENRIVDLRDESLKNILSKTHGDVTAKSLPVYEYLLKDRHESFTRHFGTKEEDLCWQYEKKYREFCKIHKDTKSRVDKMETYLFLIENNLKNGTFDN